MPDEPADIVEAVAVTGADHLTVDAILAALRSNRAGGWRYAISQIVARHRIAAIEAARHVRL